MKKKTSDSPEKQALATNTGTLIYAIKSMIGFMEEQDSPSPNMKEDLESLKDSIERIVEIVHDEEPLEGGDDFDEMTEILYTLPAENTTHIIKALKTFADIVRKSAESSKGKKLEMQVFILKRLTSVMKTIVLCISEVKSEETRWEAFSKAIETEERYLKRAQQEGKEETERQTALLDGIRDKFSAADRTKDFQETMGLLYKDLDEESKDFFFQDLLWKCVWDMKCNLDEMMKEYAGIAMDFSQYERRIVALIQLRSIIRRVYRPAAALATPGNPAERLRSQKKK